VGDRRKVPVFSAFDETSQNGHTFSAHDCSGESGDLAGELAEDVRELYVEPEELAQTLKDAMVGLDSVAETDSLSEVVDRVTAAAIPEPGTTLGPAHLDVARNELAEVIAYRVLESVSGTTIPAKRVREKEIHSAPARGMDLLGLDLDPGIALVISEVKASEDSDSPPSVVGVGKASLHEQLRAFLGDKAKIIRELNWCLKHAPAALRDAVARALLLFLKDAIDLVVAPVLVRSHGACQLTDYGCFKDEPAEYAPANVRFFLIRLEGSIEELAKEVYDRAREGAP